MSLDNSFPAGSTLPLQPSFIFYTSPPESLLLGTQQSPHLTHYARYRCPERSLPPQDKLLTSSRSRHLSQSPIEQNGRTAAHIHGNRAHLRSSWMLLMMKRGEEEEEERRQIIPAFIPLLASHTLSPLYYFPSFYLPLTSLLLSPYSSRPVFSQRLRWQQCG